MTGESGTTPLATTGQSVEMPTPLDVVLFPTVRSRFWTMVISAGYTAFGCFVVFLLQEPGVVGWVGGLTALTIAPFYLLFTVIETYGFAHYVRLSPNGLSIRTLFRRRHFDWAEIEVIGMENSGQFSFAAFSLVPASIAKLDWSLRNLGPGYFVLSNHYGMSANDLVLMLEEWRSRYGKASLSMPPSPVKVGK